MPTKHGRVRGMSLRRDSWPEEARQRVKAGTLLDRLHKHVEGKIELTATQIRAAEILLRKVLPDLQAVVLKTNEDNRSIAELSKAELLALASPDGAGETIEGVAQPVGVH